MIATAALADEKICHPDHLLHSHIYGVEYMQKLLYENSLARGERVNGICTILDFEGLGFHHRQCLSVLRTLLDFDKKYYPEYLGKLYVINTPWVGPYLYQAVQVFLDEVTKSRVRTTINSTQRTNNEARRGGSTLLHSHTLLCLFVVTAALFFVRFKSSPVIRLSSCCLRSPLTSSRKCTAATAPVRRASMVASVPTSPM